MMLFKPSSTGVGRLELYAVVDNSPVTDQKKVGWQKTPDKKVVRLSDFLSVSPAPKESCPQGCTAFYLKTIQSTYTLASTTSQDWQSALCLLAFQVSHTFLVFILSVSDALSFGKAGGKASPHSETDSTMRKSIQYL